MGVLLMNRLNGHNTQPGLAFVGIPASLSHPLIDILLPLGLITPVGKPVLRVQPQHTIKVSAQEFWRNELSYVGSWDEVWGTNDMIFKPDTYAWLNPSDFAHMMGFDSVVGTHMHSINTPAAQHLVGVVGDLVPHSVQPASKDGAAIWMSQLVAKFYEGFLSTACMIATASTAHETACMGGAWEDSTSLHVSGDGGNGRGGCLTAVGGGDEEEMGVGEFLVCMPCAANLQGSSRGRKSVVASMAGAATNIANTIASFACSWW